MLRDAGPEWIDNALRVARSFRATTRRAPGAKHSVYVVLLHDPRRSEPWGLYVGQTARDPDLRFDQHKTGYKSSSAARRFGVRLLPDMVAHLNPMRQWESLDLEEALAEALRAGSVGWVEGGH
jgi:predicted GIY-YIG superfamily endonuclease